MTDTAILKQQAARGVVMLSVRRVLFQLILTGGNIILARLLFPTAFGAFGIAQGIINLFLIFGSLSLGSALIQQKNEPTEQEIRSAFIFTLVLTAVVVGLLYFVAPFLARYYAPALGADGTDWLRFLALSLLVLPVKEISIALLERKMAYSRVVMAEMAEILLMQAVTILLALKGWQTASFVWGAVVSRTVGGGLAWLLVRWPIGWPGKLTFPGRLMSFGWNMQLTNVINTLRSAFVPLFVGWADGAAGVGFLTFAGGLAVFPLFISEVASRIIFPLGARFQDDSGRMIRVIERSMRLTYLTTFPLIVLVAVLAEPITLLVYTDKWQAGITAVRIFTLQSVFNLLALVPGQVLLAIGKVKIVRNITLIGVVIQSAAAVPLVLRYGFVGMAWASLAAALIWFIPVWQLKRIVPFAFRHQLQAYLPAALVMGTAIGLLNHYWPAASLFRLINYCAAGVISYIGLVWIFDRRQITGDGSTFINALFVGRKTGEGE